MIQILLSILVAPALAQFDCADSKPFKIVDTQKAHVEIARFFWTDQAGQKIEDAEEICSMTVSIPTYDIRGREEEAYWCLKGSSDQVVSCPMMMDGEKAQVFVLAAVWIRHLATTGTDLRDSHFHAYVVSEAAPTVFRQDVFARAQLEELKPVPLRLDGAHKNGEPGYRDGYYVMVRFQP